MSRIIVLMFVALMSLNAFAQEGTQPRHLISVGTGGIGWSGIATVFDWDKDKSNIKDQETTNSKMQLNYSYIFASRWMIGAVLGHNADTSQTKLATGEKVKSETVTSSIEIVGGYNFNEDLFNSWWVQLALGSGFTETEEKDPTATPVKTDTKTTVGYVRMAGGKRIALDGLGIKNVTFSPSLELVSSNYGKDADDEGKNSSVSLQINILKFDVLF